MNRGNAWVRGYTIVEVLIFLATTTALFAVSMRLISGQQGKTQFVTTIRDMESTINDIANNVATGYYTKSGNFRCFLTGSGNIQVQPDTGVDQGTNEECIYAGTVIKFGESANGDTYLQIPMAGRRLLSGKDVTSLIEAAPVTLYQPTPTPVTGVVTRASMPFGARVSCIKINGGSCGAGNSALGFFTTFNGTDTNSRKGGIQTDLLYINANINASLNGTAAIINSTFASLTSAQLTAMRPEKVEICIRSGSSNQYAFMTLGGGSSSNLTVTSEIKEITGSTPVCS
jgi:hypothetical protein